MERQSTRGIALVLELCFAEWTGMQFIPASQVALQHARPPPAAACCSRPWLALAARDAPWRAVRFSLPFYSAAAPSMASYHI